MDKGITTCFAIFNSSDAILNGEEVFEVCGPFFQSSHISVTPETIIGEMKGMKRHWMCIEKAILVRRLIGAGIISLGEMAVWNNERTGTYGFHFNPPYEFHAWVWLPEEDWIIDFALPGVIEMGLQTKDQFGSILQNIKPVILAGPVPDWLYYNPKEFVPAGCKSSDLQKLFLTLF